METFSGIWSAVFAIFGKAGDLLDQFVQLDVLVQSGLALVIAIFLFARYSMLALRLFLMAVIGAAVFYGMNSLDTIRASGSTGQGVAMIVAIVAMMALGAQAWGDTNRKGKMADGVILGILTFALLTNINSFVPAFGVGGDIKETLGRTSVFIDKLVGDGKSGIERS